MVKEGRVTGEPTASSKSPVRPHDEVAHDVEEGGDVDGVGGEGVGERIGELERFLDDDIVGEIVVGQGCWRFRRPRESASASLLPDVAGELAYKEDGAGQGLAIRVDYHLPSLDEMLKLPDHRSHGQELRSKVEYQNSGLEGRRLKKESGSSPSGWC